MSGEPYPISLQSIERHTLQRPAQPGWLVTFNITRGGPPETALQFRTFVSDNVPEEHILAVARSHLAHTFEKIATDQSDWKLSKDEINGLLKVPSENSKK